MSQSLFEMSNLTYEETNIPIVIWVSVKGKAKHGPRIKISKDLNADDLTPVTVEDNPRFLFLDKKHKYEKEIRSWIVLNKDLILQYWNSQISTAVLLKKVQPILKKGKNMGKKKNLKESDKDLQAEILKVLSKDPEDTLESFKEDGSEFTFEFDGDEYKGYESEDAAIKAAIDQVVEDLENDPENFNQESLKEYMYVGVVDIRIMSGEEADSRIESMDDEDIIKEADMEDEYEAASDDEKEKILDKAKEELYDQYYEEISKQLEKDPVGYFDDIGGDEMVQSMIKQNFLSIDEKEAAKAFVDEDGWAHFLSHYDGNYEETSSGTVFFRV